MNILWSIAGIIIITTISALLSNFFGIDQKYYLPFVIWFISLFLFNMFLEKEHINIFMKDILNV